MKKSLKKEFKSLFESEDQNNAIENFVTQVTEVLNKESRHIPISLVVDNKKETMLKKFSYSMIIDYAYFLTRENFIRFDDINTLFSDMDAQQKDLIDYSHEEKSSHDKRQLVASKITKGPKLIESSTNNEQEIASFIRNYYSDGELKQSERKLAESGNLNEFKGYLFYFLYKKFISERRPHIQPINNVITENVNNIINYFLSRLQSNAQTCLTVNFGALFEEIFRQEVFKIISKSNKEYPAFDLDVKLASKKVGIVLLYCCNGLFEDDAIYPSAVYNSIKAGRKASITEYKEDFENIRFSDSATLKDVLEHRSNLLNTESERIINDYCKQLGLNRNNVYIDDFENDGEFSVGSACPFDFIIRDSDIMNTDKNIGLFDTKVTNTYSTSTPYEQRYTGNNGGTANSALGFINDIVKQLNEKNANIGIEFFSLLQIKYRLDFDPKNDYEIEIQEIKHLTTPAKTSFNYSDCKDHFYLTYSDVEKTLTASEEDGEHDPFKSNIISKPIKINQIKTIKTKKVIKDFLRNLVNVYNNNGSVLSQINSENFISIIFIVNPRFYTLINDVRTLEYKEFIDKYSINNGNNGSTFINQFNNAKNDKYFDPASLIELLYKYNTSSTKEKSVHKEITISMDKEYIRFSGPRISKAITNILVSPYDNGNKVLNLNEFFSDCKVSLRASPEMSIGTKFPAKNLGLQKILEKIKEGSRFNTPQQNSTPTTQTQSYIRSGKTLMEVYSYLFGFQKTINEGALAGRMIYPYEALDMTTEKLVSRIKQYGVPQKIIEKVDGQNLFFTVEKDGTLLFARNKEDMTHDDLVEKFTSHPAEKPFIEGGNAIKAGVESLLNSISQEEIIRLFHPSEGIRTFVNFEIMHPEKPNQIMYDEKYIVFHGVVDYRTGREEVSRSNQDQRIQELVTLMNSGVSSEGFTLASNREVDLNQLTDVQIAEYTQRVYDIAETLGMEEGETLGDGIMNVIGDEIEAEGVSLSDEALTIFTDYIIRGEDSEGRSIASRDWTKFLSKEDVAKLRQLGLTSTAKVKSKISKILQPFKTLFVEIGIILLKDVQSSYMSKETAKKNIELNKDKLSTALFDLDNYLSSTPEEAWPNAIRSLIKHKEEVDRLGIENIVSTSVEGGVYNIDDSLEKVTGGFGPMNQIIGAAYRDNQGIFTTFKEKFMQQENNRRSLRDIFSLIF